MPPIPVSFGVASNKGRMAVDANVRLVNAYARALGPGGKSEYALYAAPGLKPWAQLSRGPHRGATVVNGRLYVVSGRSLYVVTPQRDVTELAGVPGDGPVTFASNAIDQTDILFLTAGRIYHIKSGVVTPWVSDVITGTVVDIDFIRGRFIIATATGVFYYTGINSITVDGDAFYNAEGKPDGLVGTWVRRNELWLLGTETVELWAPTKEDDDPFDQLGAGALPVGCLSAATIAENNDDIFWVDNNKQVRRANGYTPREISPEWVVETIEDEPDPTSLRGWCYTIGGVNWYELSGSTFTLRYNLNTNQWTERETLGLKRWRGSGAIGFDGGVLIGDHASGQIWKLDPECHLDGDAPIVMRLQSPIIHAWPMPLSVNSLHVDVASGVGVNSSVPEDADPQIVLRLSEDGGETWFGPLSESLGRQGERARVIFRQLGMFERHGATIELTVSAAVAKCVMAAVINGVPGST